MQGCLCFPFNLCQNRAQNESFITPQHNAAEWADCLPTRLLRGLCVLAAIKAFCYVMPSLCFITLSLNKWRSVPFKVFWKLLSTENARMCVEGKQSEENGLCLDALVILGACWTALIGWSRLVVHIQTINQCEQSSPLVLIDPNVWINMVVLSAFDVMYDINVFSFLLCRNELY